MNTTELETLVELKYDFSGQDVGDILKSIPSALQKAITARLYNKYMMQTPQPADAYKLLRQITKEVLIEYEQHRT
jgi:hypothetical protein